MPWRNGQGTTTELAREDGEGASGFLWRLSRADVTQDGAFSNFPGIDRLLLLISGAGLTLAFDDHVVTLDGPYQMARFAGDVPVYGTLGDGPCRDFNIMVDRARARVAATVHDAAACGRATSRTLLHVLKGSWVLQFDGAKTALPEDSLLLLNDEAGKPYDVSGRGFLLRIEIELV